MGQYLELRMGFYHTLSFNKMKIKYLEAPYQTNCLNYNLDSTDGYQMNVECVQHCLEHRAQQKCSLCQNQLQKCCFELMDGSIWPINWINKYHYGNLTYCQSNSCIYLEKNSLLYQCESECKKNCINRYYTVNEIRSDIIPSDLFGTNANTWIRKTSTFIKLVKSKLPDEVTEHRPEMSFNSFFGNFGGTVGIWLGLSVIAVFEYLIKYYN